MKESENLFVLMKNVLEKFKENIPTPDNSIMINNYLMIFEIYINPYEELVQFFCALVESNYYVKNSMKDYLHFQNNNLISYNFISLISEVLDCYNNTNNIQFMKYNFFIILKCVEFLTNSCKVND